MNEWKAYFQDKGYQAVCLDSRSGAGIKAVTAAIQEACRAKIERDRKTGDFKPAGPRHGSGDPQCGKVHIYQHAWPERPAQRQEISRA